MHNAFKLPITETHNNNNILFSIAIDPAKIIKYQNGTVQVGGNTALVCLAEGYPAPNTTWIRDIHARSLALEVPYSFAQLRVPILEVILAVQRTLQGLQTVQRFFLKLQVKAKFNITNL